MPELLGMARAAGLEPDDGGRIQGLAREFHESPDARDESAASEGWILKTRAQHSRDPAAVFTQAGASVAWIGRGAPQIRRPQPHRALEGLRRNDLSPLASLEMGFAAAFAFEHELWLVSDLNGLHPLYYWHDGATLLFGSKVSPLVRSGLVPNCLDNDAVLDFFTFEHVTGDRSFIQGVQLLPPASALRFAEGRIELQTYATLQHKPSQLSLSETIEQFHTELDRSVASALSDAERVAIPLSGGLDSRALLGAATPHASHLRTYTFGPAAGRETSAASALARAAGVSNQSQPVPPDYLDRWLAHGVAVTDGMVSCTQFHINSLAEPLRNEADVVLDGLAGDALTGGHLKPAMLWRADPIKAIDQVYRQRATAWATPEARTELFEPEFFAQTGHDPWSAVGDHFAHLDGAPLWWGCHRFDLRERQRRFVQFGPHQLRPFVDVKTPFYTPALWQLLTTTPASHLFSQRAYLSMHARYFPELARIPDSDRGLPLSTPLVLRLAKQVGDGVLRRVRPTRTGPDPASPTNYADWLRHELRPMIEQRLLASQSWCEGVLKPAVVERTALEHFRGEADHTSKLGCLLSFQEFRRGLQSS